MHSFIFSSNLMLLLVGIESCLVKALITDHPNGALVGHFMPVFKLARWLAACVAKKPAELQADTKNHTTITVGWTASSSKVGVEDDGSAG